MFVTKTEKPKQEKKKRKSMPNNIENGRSLDYNNHNGKKQKRRKKSKDSLPRTRQLEIETKDNDIVVMGIDEAGTGPLAGPVVAAAVVIPATIDGIVDSKKLTKEEVREDLYHQILASPNLQWSVAVINAKVIDEINVEQATLLAMQRACAAVVNMKKEKTNQKSTPSLPPHIEESYTICGSNDADGKSILLKQEILNDCSKLVDTYDKSKLNSKIDNRIDRFHALIDGDRLPPNMPVGSAESIVKGDGKEYCIAAASIIAKVTRDNIMVKHYDKLYPEYNLKKHKGYPTSAHVDAIYEHNKISPVHRRSYAPLKHLIFDAEGKILGKKEKKKKKKKVNC